MGRAIAIRGLKLEDNLARTFVLVGSSQPGQKEQRDAQASGVEETPELLFPTLPVSRLTSHTSRITLHAIRPLMDFQLRPGTIIVSGGFSGIDHPFHTGNDFLGRIHRGVISHGRRHQIFHQTIR